MIGCAQLKTAWNMMKRIARRIRRPATGCSTTASIRVVNVSGLAGGVTAAAMIRSASRCSARSSVAESGRQEFAPLEVLGPNESR